MDGMIPHRRLFSYWPFPPGDAEPAHGYFLRLVSAQGETSIRNFNIANEIATEAIFPKRMLEDLEAHPIPRDWLAMLRSNTPVKDGKSHYLRGHRLNYYQIRLTPRRWCPGCLNEDAYHRAWWDIESIHSCPFHGVDLENSYDDDVPVTWQWLDFVHTKSGAPLARRIDSVPVTLTYARYLIGRFGWAEPLPVELLDSFEVSDVIHVCEFLGQVLEASERRKSASKTRKTVETGFHALCGNRGDLAEALRAKLRSYEDDATGDNINVYFQSAATRLNELSDGPRALLRRALREAYVAEKLDLGRRIEDRDFDVEFVSSIDVGRELSMGPGAVRKIARVLGGYQGARNFGSIPVDLIASIGDFRDSLLTRYQARKKLGLPQGSVNHLVKAGFLTKFRNVRTGEPTGGMFSPIEVDAIIERIGNLEVTAEDVRSCTFTGYQKAYNVRGGALACQCLQGKVRVIKRLDGKPGFLQLVLEGRSGGEPPRLDTAMPILRSTDLVTIFEAEVLLNLTGHAMRSLVRGGHLRVAEQYAKLTHLRREEVVAFGEANAKVSDFATCLMMEPKHLEKRLYEQGVQPVVRLGRDSLSGSGVFRRSDILAMLDLEKDPTLYDDEKLVQFWDLFVRSAMTQCPSLILPSRLPPHSLFVRDVARCIRVTFDPPRPGGHEISCVVSALKCGVNRVVIDLRSKDLKTSIGKLIDAIIAGMRHGRQNFNTNRRDLYRQARPQ